MFKKLLKAGITLALLWGGYVTYVHAFDLVVQQFRTYRSKEKFLFATRPSRSKLHAIALAKQSFGADHWSVTGDLPFMYYSSEHGFWMYSLDVKEIQEEGGVRYDGKRLKLKPFAVIAESADGRKHQTLTADRATLDLSQPLSLSAKQGGDPMRITHALIEGDVRIHDDRGTTSKPDDDMNIGPLTHLVFDEANQQISTESEVVMRDAEQTTTGLGLLIQLRRKDPGALAAGQSSTGFEGAEYLILHRNSRVTLRDAGGSGIVPGQAPTTTNQGNRVVKAEAVVGGSSGEKGTPAAPREPSPLMIMSDGPMRVDFAKDVVPVLVGPPAPPAPTKVRFDRNVVALQMHPGARPDQLNCDTLKLTLIPAEKPPEPKSSRPGPAEARAQVDHVPPPARPSGEPGDGADAKGQEVRVDAQAAPDRQLLGAVMGGLALVDPRVGSDAGSDSGPFGNLTLQRAHAIGHAVWLQLREQEAKVLCKELIHERRAPYQPDRTYFRGDASRQVWLEKIDREELEDGTTTGKADGDRSAKRPRRGKVTGVTHVMTADATLYDMGAGSGKGGLDFSDVVARGPGKLEVRPDLNEPVQRIAVWQDELTIHNVLGADSQLLQKKVTLTGNRPYFVDTVRNSSIDAGELIYVWLKPKRSTESKEMASADATRGHAGHTPATDSDAFAVAGTTSGDLHSAGEKKSEGAGGIGGGGLQLERLQAFLDAHFRAPGKKMEAREVLSASFVEAEPIPVVAAERSEPAEGAAETPATEANGPGTEPAKGEAPAAGTVAAKDAGSKPPAEPNTTGVADRIWAKVALKPDSGLDAGSIQSTKRTAAKPARDAGAIAAAGQADAPSSGSGESETDVREAWLWGNVTLHQESPPETAENPDGTKAKAKKQDVTGEAVYMDNSRGKGKMLARVYDHNPNGPRRPGPWPLARVADDDKTIRSTLIRTDQEHDKVWCDGPGELTQLTERSLFTDKKPDSKADGGAGADEPGAVAEAPPGGNRIRTSSGTKTVSVASKGSASASKPKTRGGKPIGDKDLLTIIWSRRMEFTGRATDPTTKQPAGKAEFFGYPNATMEDAQLKCDDRMIVYTDREMPLGELGSISKAPNRTGEEDGGDGEAKAESSVDLSLIYCFGKSVAVTRKLDPDVPVILEQHIIYAEHRLDYNRRTGEFIVPGPGEFYKYERKDESEKKPGDDGKPGGSAEGPAVADGRSNGGRANRAGRTVTPTSGRTTASSGPRTPRPNGGGDASRSSEPPTPPVSRKIPPLVLTQVFFSKGMQGQVGSSQDINASQARTAILFGDIQLRHAQVNSVQEAFNFDQPLTDDGFYLTSQILRLIQEPPMPGSPPSTPARSFLKAWDNVIVNKGQSLVIESDVGTYDSGTDLLYAYGESDRGVSLLQQYAVGQRASPAFGRALLFNVKSGEAHFIESDVVQLFDKRTGARPGIVGAPDPNVKKPKRRATPFMVPNNNLERRGFTAQ